MKNHFPVDVFQTKSIYQKPSTRPVEMQVFPVLWHNILPRPLPLPSSGFLTGTMSPHPAKGVSVLHFCTERKENGLTDLVRVGTEQPNHVRVRRGWQWSSHAEDRQGWRFPCSGVAVEVSKRTLTQEVRDTPLSYVASYVYCCTDEKFQSLLVPVCSSYSCSSTHTQSFCSLSSVTLCGN